MREWTENGGERTAGRAEGALESPFSWPIRVYWEDTDAGGIVYYANYMKFMERARTEWLRAAGVEQAPLREEHGILFVVVDVQAHYRKPARYGELLAATCRIAQATRASLTFGQQIRREHSDGELLVEGRVRVACLGVENYRPRPLPESMLDHPHVREAFAREKNLRTG